GDVDFCYGSRDGMLWQIIDRIFDLDLKYENTAEAVEERKKFLASKGIGICDTVESCRRDKIDASDLGMLHVELRDLIGILKRHEKIDTLLFTGGNSKNGPEFFFRKLLKHHEIKIKVISNDVPRVHQFLLDGRPINTVSLTAPSGSANRAIGSMELYKHLKKQNPEFNTIDFRVLQYRQFLED
ncbi:MAG: uracil-DNA glycosylase family protein, partial [Salinimicrobium sediminis]|nr:uracil-DNA glycosylase family protein [Salinimicrobium sediminis]